MTILRDSMVKCFFIELSQAISEAKLNQMKIRLTNLSHKYLVKATNSNNELIMIFIRKTIIMITPQTLPNY